MGKALSYIAPLENLLNVERRKILLEKGIGLWDIFECVEREKSNQDKAIRKAKYNDIYLFLNQHPSVEYLVFNGGNAFEWLREDKSGVFERENLDTKKLQSSSGGNGHFNQGKDWEEYFKIIYKLLTQ